MKPTTEIKSESPENSALFDNDFYRRFTLRHAPKPLQLNESVSKNYLFPTFYGDVTCAIGIFLCSYDKAAAISPHPAIKPVRMTRGRSLVIFSCYEYKNVHEVAPYNEIAMTIPVMVDPAINVPVLPMILPVFSKFGFYVFSMPVTSLENQLRGTRIWGLPKVVREIDVREKNGDCVTVCHEEDGTPYLELAVPMQGKPTRFDVRSNLYSRLGDRLLQAPTCFRADFNVNKYMGQLLAKGARPDREYLKIGDSPSGRLLKQLEIEPHPFQFRFAKGMSACFDLPNENFKSPIEF